MQLSITKGYEGSDDEERVKDVRLEGEESQAHVGEDEVLRQEVQQLEKLKLGQRERKKKKKRREEFPVVTICTHSLTGPRQIEAKRRLVQKAAALITFTGGGKKEKKHFLTTISEIFAANAGTICS